MRTCRGATPSETLDDDTTVQSYLNALPLSTRIADDSPTVVESDASHPVPSSSSSVLLEGGFIRGISPDPHWGPRPLRDWKPTQLPPTSHPSFPMPIAQRVYIGEATAHQDHTMDSPGTSFNSLSSLPSPPLTSVIYTTGSSSIAIPSPFEHTADPTAWTARAWVVHSNASPSPVEYTRIESNSGSRQAESMQPHSGSETMASDILDLSLYSNAGPSSSPDGQLDADGTAYE